MSLLKISVDRGTLLLVSIVFVFPILSCENKRKYPGVYKQHPDLNWMASRDNFYLIKHGYQADRVSEELAHFAKRLQLMQLEWRVGSMNSINSWEIFGRITSVARDRKDRVFVLDNQYAEIRVFNENGAFLFTIGEKGEGPGSFMYPEWIAVDPWDTVYVADRAQMKVEVFAPDENAYIYRRTILLPRIASGGICVDSSSVFISTNNMYNDSLIYHLDKNGNILSKFGNILYKSENPIVRSYITRNYMVCDLKNKIVFIAFRYAPIVKLYDYEGNLLWQIWISNLNLSGFAEFETGDVGFPDKEQEINLIGIAQFDSHFIVQYFYVDNRLKNPVFKTFAYLINPMIKEYFYIDSLLVAKIFRVDQRGVLVRQYDEIPHVAYYSY